MIFDLLSPELHAAQWLLAQLSLPGGAPEWLLSFAAFLFLLKMGADFYRDHIKAKDPMPPFSAQFADKFETAKRLDQLQQEIESLQKEQHRQFIVLTEKGEDRKDEIITRIDALRLEIRTSLANAQKRMDGHGEQIAAVTARFNDHLQKEGQK